MHASVRGMRGLPAAPWRIARWGRRGRAYGFLKPTSSAIDTDLPIFSRTKHRW